MKTTWKWDDCGCEGAHVNGWWVEVWHRSERFYWDAGRLWAGARVTTAAPRSYKSLGAAKSAATRWALRARMEVGK